MAAHWDAARLRQWGQGLQRGLARLGEVPARAAHRAAAHPLWGRIAAAPRTCGHALGGLAAGVRERWNARGAVHLPLWSWALVLVGLAALGALAWLTWNADQLVSRSVRLQESQIAAWEVGNLQRQLLRMEGSVSTVLALRKVRDPKALRSQLMQVVEAGAILQREEEPEGLQRVADWRPKLRRIRAILNYIENHFDGFLADPMGAGPALLTGLREIVPLTEELSALAYEANTRQANATMVTLLSVQRYLAAVQGLLVALTVVLVLGLWFSLRARLRTAYAQIEAQRLVEAELRASRDAAEEANRTKSRFLASMSHELRTPLTAMLGNTQLMLRSTFGKMPKKVREATERIAYNGNHLLRLVNDVLDLSRIEAGRMELQRQPSAPEDAIHDAIARLEVLAQQKGLTLEAELNGALPQVALDRRRVSQVLINLIGNSIKFTEQGGIRVGAAVEGPELRYFVADTGIGIEPERLDSLFQEFQGQDAHIARDAPGAGLGLAIARRLVQLHGGRIWVESRVGAGTTFRFSLPLDEDHGQGKGEGQSDAEADDPQRGGQSGAADRDAHLPGVPGVPGAGSP